MAARRELALVLRRLTFMAGLIFALLLLGAIGFVVIENTSFWYGFAWSLDTVATVGSIPEPASTGGQVLKAVLELLGVGTLFYVLVTLAEFFVRGHAGELLEARRQQRMIDSLSDHYIICGFGRVGRQVARDLAVARARYVVIDENPANREFATGVGVRFIEGTPSDDEVLRSAGIARARGILACVDSDPENIFITLTARELRGDDIVVVARASSEDSEPKLRRAGADRIISPYKSSGSEMARIALHPQVAGAVDVDADFRLEEIEVVSGCNGEGSSIADVRGGAIIVAVRRASGDLLAQPAGDTRLGAGDRIVALGTGRTLDRLEALFEPTTARA